MPVISMFYGVIVMMYFYDTDFHHLPHIHIKYAELECSLNILNGDILSGKIPPKQLKLVLAWLEIHQEELLANWELAKSGIELFKIEPLK